MTESLMNLVISLEYSFDQHNFCLAIAVLDVDFIIFEGDEPVLCRVLLYQLLLNARATCLLPLAQILSLISRIFLFSSLDELVEHNVNGVVFDDASTLTKQLLNAFKDFPQQSFLNGLRKNVEEFRNVNWDDSWDRIVLPIFHK